MRISSARAAKTIQLHTHAMCVDKDSVKKRIAQVCGINVITVNDALYAETAAGLNAQQIIAKLVKRAEILIATKPQREVVVQTP